MVSANGSSYCKYTLLLSPITFENHDRAEGGSYLSLQEVTVVVIILPNTKEKTESQKRGFHTQVQTDSHRQH